MRKDMTAGDVHVSSTGTSTKPKRKKIRPAGEFISTVKGKSRAFQTDIQVTKLDPDQRLIFGWASVAAINGQEVVDKQGDIIPVPELEKAAYDFVLYSREQGDMHSQIGVGRLVESLVFTAEKAAIGLVAKNEQGEQIYGWFVGFKVESDEVWKAHKDGRRPELSIGGRASVEES